MSVVNIEHKVIFAHVPKTGGTSMEQALTDFQFDHNDYHSCGRGHSSMQHLVDTAVRLFHPLDVDVYFKFGFVRNPYSRAVSLYMHHSGGTLDTGFKPWLLGTAPHHVCKEKDQGHFLCADSGELLTDFVGRFENLQEDWKHVCSKIGKEIELPWIKTGSQCLEGRDWQAYYDDESRARIQELFKRDFDMFGYEE